MNKYISLLFLVTLLLVGTILPAQCPLTVNIASIPDVSVISVCKSDPVQLEANPSIGALTPQYIWVIDGDTIIGADSIINILANNQNIQVYMATTTGCTQDTVSTSIQVQTILMQSTVTILNSSCDLTTADIQINATGGTAPYNYNLVGIGTSNTGLYNNVPAGNYTLYITDNQGCNDTNQITITPQPHNLLSASTPIMECNQTIADVVTSTTGGTAPYSYDLQGIGQNSNGFFSDVSVGDYTLITTDSQGCKDTNMISVVSIPCDDPEPTEIITPNGDGQNDMWLIRKLENFPDNEVFIFDRWGQRIYHKKGYDNLDGWEAKYVGLDMPVSTYYYVLKLKVKQGDDIIIKGAISVFR